jgi:hypothetical protein
VSRRDLLTRGFSPFADRVRKLTRGLYPGFGHRKATVTSHLHTVSRHGHTTTRDLLDATLRTIRLITRR